jgi:riboflavin synthase alpha subunit
MKNIKAKLELVRQVFPNVLVEPDGEGITIDLFLRIDPSPVKVKTLRGEISVDGYSLTVDTGEDVAYLGDYRRLEAALIEAAAYYAKWRATRIMDAANLEAFVNEEQAYERVHA